MKILLQPLPQRLEKRFQTLLTAYVQGGIPIETVTKRAWALTPWIEVREEIWSLAGNDPTPITSAYNNSGHYVGDLKFAKYLAGRCIRPTVRSTGAGTVCCIGYSKPDDMWYGWSHRAMVGFSVGDKIFDIDYGDDNTLYTEHGDKTIETLADAKLAAERFSEYVS